MNLELREATAAELAGWDDLVRRFPQPRVEQTYAWIQSLAAAGSGRPLFLVWTVNGEIVGCLPGLLTNVGPLTLFGSPLPGWQTGGMGPLYDPARVTTSQLIGALLPVLEERYGVDHIEMLCDRLEAGAMAQLGFRGEPVPTYRAPLYPGDEGRQLKAWKDSARRNLKRAQRLGIQVKFVTDDAFVELHYAQLRDVYVRGGNAIPFGVDRVRETFRHARDSNRLIAVTASLADGATVIASGIFATEGKELLLWSWAHSTRYRWYRATEMLTWAVMARAMERGCETFDFMGLGDFKTKFGATLDHSKTRWVRSRTRMLTRMRDTAARVFGWQQALRGRISRALPRVFNRGAEEERAVALVMGDATVAPPLQAAGIPTVTREQQLDDLLRFGWAQPEPPALFYCDESQLAFVAEHRERLSQAFRFVLPAKSPATAKTAAARADAAPKTMIESYHVYVDEQGKVAGEFTGRQMGTVLETTNDADVQTAGRAIVQKAKLRGVASIEFQRGQGDTLELLRVTPWFNRWHHVGARAGVNLPALVYADLVGVDRPAAAVARPGVQGSAPLHHVPPAPPPSPGSTGAPGRRRSSDRAGNVTMFFSAYVGPESGRASWEAAVQAHARWLGCQSTVTAAPAPAGTARAIAQIGRETTEAALAGSANWVTVSASAQDDGFEVRVPPASPQHCYVTAAFGGRVLTDDLRLCATLTGAALDPVGVYALLLYGTTPPPFTMLRGVSRLAGGHVFRVAAAAIKATRDFVADAAPTADPALAERRVSDVLDQLIGGLPANTLLFFSGGVDSALLAARAARLGRRDLQLVNYAFSPSDPEAAHALRVASHLKLACERVGHDDSRVGDVLGRLASDYAFPFGDLSALPTNVMVHAALSGGSTRPVAAVEGTGADGAFGLSAGYRRYQSVFDLPTFVRSAGDAVYRGLGLWRRNSYLERALRFFRKSTRMQLGPAVIAHSALDGIAFDVPAESARLWQEVDVLGESASPEERLSLLDLACVCAGRMAPKTFDPLRTRGVRTLYPYLEPDLVRASTSVTWGIKSARGEAKALLKTMLARDLPASLVYRAKSGFTPPYRTTLGSAPLQAFMHDVVLAADNPLLEWCDDGVIRELVKRAGGRTPLSVGAVDFLWTLTFASGWMRQLPRTAA